MWRILGLLIVLATVGLATCQSLLNSGPQSENTSGQQISGHSGSKVPGAP